MQEALSQNGSPGGGRAKWKFRQRKPKGMEWGHHSEEEKNVCHQGGGQCLHKAGEIKSKIWRQFNKNQCFKNTFLDFQREVLETWGRDTAFSDIKNITLETKTKGLAPLAPVMYQLYFLICKWADDLHLAYSIMWGSTEMMAREAVLKILNNSIVIN